MTEFFKKTGALCKAIISMSAQTRNHIDPPVDPDSAGQSLALPLGVLELEKIADLLDQFAGPGEGRHLIERVLLTGDRPASVASDIAQSAAFAHLYKIARTLDIGSTSQKEADPKFVGLGEIDPHLSFDETFERIFFPRLGRRAESFATIFKSIRSRHQRPVIVETGCLRVPGNWEGDGQSTFMFDALARDSRGSVFSIDITAECIDTARRACSSATQLICNDSISALHALSQIVLEPISLLYLDSFDLDLQDPAPSAIHHLLELTAARPLLGAGTIVCVDDYEVGNQSGGKGMLVDKFFSQIRSEILYSGYQKVWLFT
jgi:hypothetical protein